MQANFASHTFSPLLPPLLTQTLLDALSGRSGGTVQLRGEVRVNGRPATRQQVAAASGYVMQVKGRSKSVGCAVLGKFDRPQGNRWRLPRAMSCR